jgi:capsular exopolysaccharide synthesis family protein
MDEGTKLVTHEPVETTETLPHQFIDILWYRRKVVVSIVLLSMAFSVYFFFKAHKYRADGAIRIEPNSASMYRSSPSTMLFGNGSEELTSDTQILQSRTLFLQVAKDLKLYDEPTFWGGKLPKQHSLDDPYGREQIARQMRKTIIVSHNPKDEMIDISCISTSPGMAASIVNTLIDDYVQYLFKMKLGATQRTSGWLVNQLGDLQKQIQNDQVAITELQGKLGIIGLDEKNTEMLESQSLSVMTKAAADAKVERMVSEAKLRFLQESDPGLIEGEVNLLQQGPTTNSTNSLLQNLRNSQANAASAYAKSLSQFGPNYPEVKREKAELDEFTKQLAAEQARVVNQARISYDAARENERLASRELENEQKDTFTGHGDMVRYALLLHDYQAQRTLYEGLVQRLREAGITSGLDAGGVDIVDLADIPAIPLPPGGITIIALGFLGGVALGIIGALIAEVLDDKIMNDVQAGRITGLPLLGVLPKFDLRSRVSNPRSAFESEIIVNPSSRYSEAIESLRSSILFSVPGRPPKVILVTSAAPGEGKSTTSSNLAIAMAQHRVKVLLIDCDLRRGILSSRVGVPNDAGLSDVLTGQSTLDKAIKTIEGTDGLYLLTAGHPVLRPAVLMASSEVSTVLDECKRRFDFIILDTPPIVGISDTLNIARLAETILLVVRQGYSSRSAVAHAARLFRDVDVTAIGFALNVVDIQGPGYGYGYGYQYANYYTSKGGGE